MGDKNPIHTLGDYSKPSHEGYRNPIELPEGNNVVPLRSDTIRTREEKGTKDDAIFDDSNKKSDESKAVVSQKGVDEENGDGDKLIKIIEEDPKQIKEKELVEAPSSHPVRIPEPHFRIEKGIKNDIEPIAPTMTVNKLVLEWEEKIKLYQDKEMKFDWWRSKIFNNECPASMKEECEVKDEGEVIFDEKKLGSS
ncbi:hypothetical protein Tco_0901111 [Tanacetum coccineum]